MNFRPYDILTQLIPGILVTGFITLGTENEISDIEFNLALSALATVVAFIVGYIINGIGHILETPLTKGLNNSILKAYRINKIKFPLILFRPFSKLKYIDKKSIGLPKDFSDLFEEIKTGKYEKLDWLNQDKKFARSLIVSSILILVIAANFDVKIQVLQFKPFVLLFVLLLIALYRYLQSSIDYAIWIIKFYERRKDV